MSSSAPTTRMRLRKKDVPGQSSDSPAEGSGSSGSTSKKETKRASAKKGQKKSTSGGQKEPSELEATTRCRAKKAAEDDYVMSEDKGRGRGKKRGGGNEVKDHKIIKAELMTDEEPMDTGSDPSFDEVLAQKNRVQTQNDQIQEQNEVLLSDTRKGTRRKRQTGKEKVSQSSTSQDCGKAPSTDTRSRGHKEAKRESEALVKEENDSSHEPLPAKRSRRKKITVKEENADKPEMTNNLHTDMKVDSSSRDEPKKKSVGKTSASKSSVESVDVDNVKTKSLVEQTKTDAENCPSTKNHGKCVGAHCSIVGGLWKAVSDAVTIGAKSFALFLRSQRQWQAKPLDDDSAKRFREVCIKHGYPPHLILPHGSYLLNCGSPNPSTLSKSREALIDEMGRCQKLGLTLYNFHPGSTCGEIAIDECLDKIGESINIALTKTSGVTAVIENMSRQGNTVGGDFEELRGIIDRVNDKTRIGVCLDTCHAFAAGYDLATETGFKKMMDDFERIIGFQYLKGIHVNDSKGLVGCRKDRHENIGKGHIGLDGFRRLMNDPRLDNIPLILETPIELGYAKEIKILNSLVA